MKKLCMLVASKEKNVELAKLLEGSALDLGMQVDTINLVDLNLPLYSGIEEKKGLPTCVVEITDQVEACDALVVVAPEYNGLIPPSLNNTIAWMSVAGGDWRRAFNGKPTLIATASGGPGVRALIAMRQQLSYIGAHVVGREISWTSDKAVEKPILEACLGLL